MELLQTLILSIIQGVGEFLPISSSANLTATSKIFAFISFDFNTKVVLHLGSLVTLVLYFRHALWKIILGLFSKRVKLSQTAFYTMVFSTIPVIIIGGLGHNFVRNFDSNAITGIFLITFGIVLWLSDTLSANKPVQRCTKSTYIRDCAIGVFQSLAIIPGVSRLGICITGCRLLKMNHKQAISTSLLLAIPSIMGSLCIELYSALKSDTVINLDNNHIFGVIFTSLIGIIALPTCVKYMENHGFFWIMCYRILLGFIIIFAL